MGCRSRAADAASVLAVVLVALSLWLPGSLAEAAVTQPAGDGAIDAGAIQSDLAGDGVSVRGAPADAAALAAIVADARDEGLRLSVVVLGDNLAGGLPATESLARQLRDGSETVLVLTPDWLAADSGELTGRVMERALTAAEEAGADDVAAAQRFADAALGRGGVPWLWLIAAGVALAVVVVAGGRWWEQRRRQRADAAALTEIAERLRAELSGIADAVVALEPQVPLAEEEARQRYTEASVGYREVRQELEQPVRNRAEGERIAARIAQIRAQLDAVREWLDQARRTW